MTVSNNNSPSAT